MDLAARQLALPAKRCGVLYGDPPWNFAVWSRETGLDRDASNHYPVMSLDDIKALDIASTTADDAALFLWSTTPLTPAALEVVSAWGVGYKTHFVWAKDRIGTGYWNRSRLALLLLGARGLIPAPAPGSQWPSIIEAPTGAHSETGGLLPPD